MRYQHFLSPARGDKMPRAIVAVDCEADGLVQEEGSKTRRVRLKRWHAWSTLLDSGRPGKSRYSSGTEANGFWDSLRWLLNRGGVTWIVSYQCSKQWALLDVWERIENEQLSICGKDGRIGPDGAIPLPELRHGVPTGRKGQGARADNDVSKVPQPCTDTPGRVGKHAGRNHKAGGSGYLVLEDPPSIMHARVAGTTGTIHWVDSRNYGVTCDEPEEEGESRAAKLHRFGVDMVRTLRERGLGGLRDTAGSQAMASFRRKHLGHAILCHTDKAALALEQSAYCGGRCECFRIGKARGPVYHYDFSSLYPSVCRDHLLPVRLRHYADRDAALVVGQQTDLLACVASVTVETDKPDYPCRRNGLVVWPVGRFRTALFGPELAHAHMAGRVAAWESIAVYDMEPALRGFALECDAIRLAAKEVGNRELAHWAKRLGVSLPGKFAQLDKRWVTVQCDPPFGYYDEWYAANDGGNPTRWRTIAGVTQYEHVGSWGSDAVPGIAGYIASAGRMRLLSAMAAAGREHVLYCDTDSLFTTEQGRWNLNDAGLLGTSGMGFLRCEGIYGQCEFRGIKDYTADGRHVCAGLRVGSGDPTLDGSTYWWRPWIGVATNTKRRPSADQVLRAYNRTQPYRHGTVLADGTVEPIRIWE
jgi:hypothetical protein